jgi:hypothetical protein
MTGSYKYGSKNSNGVAEDAKITATKAEIWYDGAVVKQLDSKDPNADLVYELKLSGDALKYKDGTDSYKFTAYANEKLKDVNFNEGVYEADFLFDCDDEELITAIDQIGSRPELWSQGNDEPYFAIENIKLSCDDTSVIGKNADTLRFVKNGVTYVMFKASKLIEEVQGKTEFSLDIVGRANLNEWAGTVSPQIMIEDYNFRNTLLDF